MFYTERVTYKSYSTITYSYERTVDLMYASIHKMQMLQDTYLQYRR